MVSTDLGVIAAHLEGLEETIIHRLVDRAQFARNAPAYEAGASGFDDADEQSLFELRLRYQEEMDSAFGRYKVPEERPFFVDLPPPRRRVELPPGPLDPAATRAVNYTAEIVSHYLDYLPDLCEEDDDGQYGSAVEHDVLAIQALGRRVHYGALYVAESKFRSDPEAFRSAVRGAAESAAREPHAGRADPAARRSAVESALTPLITRPEVEERILCRVAEKVDYIQASLNPVVRRRIDPEIVLRLYRDTIIPFTKAGEIDYLIVRLGVGHSG